YLLHDLARFASRDTGWPRELQQVAPRRRPALAGDGQGVLAARAGGEEEVVGRGEGPVAAGRHAEGEDLHVDVEVTRANAAGHPAVGLQLGGMAPGEDPGHLEELAVVGARDAEVGLDQIAEGVDVEALVAVAVEALDAEEPPPPRRGEEARRRHGQARLPRQ